MGEASNIEWTDHTFNSHEGCEKISPGCKNCYAETRDAWLHPRKGSLPQATPNGTHRGAHWGKDAPRLFHTDAYWKKPLKWDREARLAGERRKVFCSSLADVFEDRPDLVDVRRRLLLLIEECDSLDWLLLTKRPENMVRLAEPTWRDEWPAHVWAGTTVEDNERRSRIFDLMRVPAGVKFLSCEPLLEEVDLDPAYCSDSSDPNDGTLFCHECGTEMGGGLLDPLNDGISWVIAGAESGRNPRPMQEAWVRSLRDQCKSQGVAFFYKQQLVGREVVSLPLLDGVQHAEFPGGAP